MCNNHGFFKYNHSCKLSYAITTVNLSDALIDADAKDVSCFNTNSSFRLILSLCNARSVACSLSDTIFTVTAYC